MLRPYLSAMLCLALLAPTARAALTPEQVLVVGNQNSPDSTELARFYAQQRRIPADNVLLLKTTANYETTRGDYQTQIVEPLRRHLQDTDRAGKIRAIVLMYGIPVRIAPQAAQSAPASQAQSPWRAAADKAHYRLYTDYKLLGTVARKFPAPATEGLAPVGKLFDTAVTIPEGKLTPFNDLLKDFTDLYALKQVQTSGLRDGAHRAIAWRQMMALTQDVYGLKGLVRLLTDNKIPDAPDVARLSAQLGDLEARLAALRKQETGDDVQAEKLSVLDQVGGAAMLYAYANEKAPASQPKENFAQKSLKSNGAAVDSELSLLWWPPYQLDGPTINPLMWRANDLQRTALGEKLGLGNKPLILMTCRIDGPTPQDARAIIANSISAEKLGLTGKFYIDAGGPHAAYDTHLRQLSSLVSTQTNIPVVFDDQKAVFGPGACPQAALYVGWYSLKKYVDAFTWEKGAVGWHIASFEAMHLRDPKTTEWAAKLIQNGVAATIGAVNEPLLQTFPLPQDFFGLLLTGQYTVAECYWYTVPTTSWQLTLIADPLYNPFAGRAPLKPTDLPKGLAR